ncbi:MAG: hypothetical protein ACOYYS_15940 [Chloroflexota bacterium]
MTWAGFLRRAFAGVWIDQPFVSIRPTHRFVAGCGMGTIARKVLPGCGGGYLYVVSDRPVPGGFP